MGYTFAQAVPIQSAAGLGTWLEANHLTNGVGDYWSSSITTVETKGDVTVRPVVMINSVLVRYSRESAASWYQDQKFQFFVYNLAMPWGSDNTQTATKTWGTPERTFVVGTYRVLVWNKPVVVQP